MKASKHEYDNRYKDPGVQYKKNNDNRKYTKMGSLGP
jgi:hypothetical protein